MSAAAHTPTRTLPHKGGGSKIGYLVPSPSMGEGQGGGDPGYRIMLADNSVSSTGLRHYALCLLRPRSRRMCAHIAAGSNGNRAASPFLGRLERYPLSYCDFCKQGCEAITDVGGWRMTVHRLVLKRPTHSSSSADVNNLSGIGFSRNASVLPAIVISSSGRGHVKASSGCSPGTRSSRFSPTQDQIANCCSSNDI